MTVLTGNRLNDGVSKSFVGGRSCDTSIGGQIVSLSCCTRMSLSVYFGAACKGGGAGVGNSLLIVSSTDSISDGIAGVGLSSGQIVSISCRTRVSLSVYFGAACKGGGAGVGNSLLIVSSTDSISDGIAGIGRSSGQIVSISCRTRMSLSVYFGAACNGGAGVGNCLLIVSSADSISGGIAGIGPSSDTWAVTCIGPLSVLIRGRISGSQCLSHIRQLSTISITDIFQDINDLVNRRSKERLIQIMLNGDQRLENQQNVRIFESVHCYVLATGCMKWP